MRWYSGTPQPDERRSRICFAWFPTKVGNMTILWELYQVVERFQVATYENPSRWREIDKRLL